MRAHEAVRQMVSVSLRIDGNNLCGQHRFGVRFSVDRWDNGRPIICRRLRSSGGVGFRRNCGDSRGGLMKIEATAKEIADLVLALQGQREEKAELVLDGEIFARVIISRSDNQN